MGRIYLGKHIRDTETAEESIINSTLINRTGKNINEATAQMSITAQLQADLQIDDFGEKKRSKE